MKYVMLLGGFVLVTVAVTEATTGDLEQAVFRFADFEGTNERYVDLAPEDMDAAIVAIHRAGNNEMLASGFTLSQPMDVRIISMGEGVRREMYDYGWIVDASNHRTVWSMDYSRTYRAGGARKNRIADDIVRLDAGSYIAYYRTDGSHSFGKWNSPAPVNAELWGLTILPLDGNRVAATSYDPDENVIAQIVRVGDNQSRRRNFSLDENTTISVYAIGEGIGGQMYDYASIQHADTRRTVWQMEYQDTEWAGGAHKNRMAFHDITLPAGNYILKYRSDGSHSYDDFNAAAPSDVLNWGVTITAR